MTSSLFYQTNGISIPSCYNVSYDTFTTNVYQPYHIASSTSPLLSNPTYKCNFNTITNQYEASYETDVKLEITLNILNSTFKIKNQHSECFLELSKDADFSTLNIEMVKKENQKILTKITVKKYSKVEFEKLSNIKIL